MRIKREESAGHQAVLHGWQCSAPSSHVLAELWHQGKELPLPRPQFLLP